MSTMYAIKDTTLTALGDAVRDKTGVKYLTGLDAPNIEPIYSVTVDVSNAQWNSNLYYSIPLYDALTAALGDKADITSYYYCTFEYETNNEQAYRVEMSDISGTTSLLFKTYNGLYATDGFLNKNNYYYLKMWAQQSDLDSGATLIYTVKIWACDSSKKFIGLNKYTPLQMAEEVSNLDVLPSSALVVTGDCTYKFSYNNWNWLIENYGDKITAPEVTVLYNMFANSSQLTKIPFAICSKDSSTNSAINCSRAFFCCYNLTEAPVIKHIRISNMAEMYSQCNDMRYIPDPDDLDDTFEFSTGMNSTSDYCAQTFYSCYSLRKIPNRYLANIRNKGTSSYSCAYRNTFYNCVSLDELKGLGVCEPSAWTSNMLNNLNSQHFSRLKAFTFAVQEDGTPYVVNWKNQTLDLTYIGYYPSTTQRNYILNYNSGITANKEVTDDATYAALKDDPDWFTGLQEYCRYNHDSAVETINSLPDTSAYGAGTNVIKFTDISGQNTDGGAINTMTEEEIAVATAKGWTVTLV